MGEGGNLALVNGTPYTWKRKEIGSNQMTHWDSEFPSEIKPGDVASVYVEFLQVPLITNRSKTTGYCVFASEGGPAFRIEVRDSPSNIQVRLSNFKTLNNPSGSQIQLGWKHNDVVSFVLSGKQDRLFSSNPPRDWMQQSLPLLGTRPLSKICLPGTHDAGMGEITHTDNIPKDLIAGFVQTQSLKIGGQLEVGSRYLDIRPEISGGAHWTGHYTGKLGARGQKMSSIIQDINNFTQTCAELIIINLSHSLNSDDGWREYNQKEWNSLFTELLQIKNRFIIGGAEAKDISLLPLSKFIGGGRAAVLIVVEASRGISIDGFADKGFYFPAQLNVRNEYSDTNDLARMVQGQIQKMQDHMRAADKRLFLISWTLTQQKPEISAADIETPAIAVNKLIKWTNENKTIRELAYSANGALMTQLLPKTGSSAFPNILYIDFMENRDYVALAMAINDRLSVGAPTS